jgi:hypothetical protein
MPPVVIVDPSLNRLKFTLNICCKQVLQSGIFSKRDMWTFIKNEAVIELEAGGMAPDISILVIEIGFDTLVVQASCSAVTGHARPKNAYSFHI